MRASSGSAVDQAANLARAERRRGEAAGRQLGRDAREDRVVLLVLGLELTMAAGDERLDRLGEVRQDLVDQPGRSARRQRGDPCQMLEQVADAAFHGGSIPRWPPQTQNICPNSGRN